MTRAMVTLFTAKPQRRPIHRRPKRQGDPAVARVALLAAISKLH